MDDDRYELRMPWDVPEPVVDDPDALEAAERAVRGDAPGGTGRLGVQGPGEGRGSAPSGWRSVVRWPESEDVRHRTVAYVALGSNLGPRPELLRRAADALGELPDTDVVAVSSVYETEPWGAEGDVQPYLNAVVVLATPLRADQLLEHTQRIEAELGRTRDGERYGPRTIDLDILLVGDEEWDRPDLVVPHPRLLERAFVVAPLLELDADLTLPDGTRVDEGSAALGPVRGRVGVLPGYERRTPRVPYDDAAEPLEFGTTYRAPADVEGRPVPELPPGDRWVPIEHTVQGMMMGYSGALSLQVHLGVLEDAGIPAFLDPPPIYASPGVPHYAATLDLRLMVPESRVTDARRALLEARHAGAELEETSRG